MNLLDLVLSIGEEPADSRVAELLLKAKKGLLEKTWKKLAEQKPFIKITKTGCWEWQRTRDIKNYGVYRIGEKLLFAHRFIYEKTIGKIPDGLVLDHLCINPPCCNPLHLEPVTSAENSRRGIFATKKKCVNGHDYSLDGFYKIRGSRQCKKCVLGRQKGYYLNRKTECPKGHRLIVVISGRRYCKECPRGNSTGKNTNPWGCKGRPKVMQDALKELDNERTEKNEI